MGITLPKTKNKKVTFCDIFGSEAYEWLHGQSNKLNCIYLQDLGLNPGLGII